MADFGLLWSITRGDPRVMIAILDGPVETGHACLSGARLETIGSVGVQSPESLRHGTHVTSVIFAKSECGLSGIAPECSGLLIPVYGGAPDGGLIPTSQVDLARAIRLAVDRGAKIINISGGELSPTPGANNYLEDALTYCEKQGVLVVAAAGNNGCECLHVPASIASVLAVGASDPQTGKPLSFSNWGTAYRKNAILAPGKDVPGAQAGGGVAPQTGTSFAAPIVTGVAALLMSIQLKRGMAADALAVRAALLQGAVRCDASVAADCRPYLVGTLDAKASLGLLGGTMDAGGPLPATADPQVHPQVAVSCQCGESRHGVAAPLPDGAESASPVEPSQAQEPSRIEADAAGGSSAHPSSSSHTEARPAPFVVAPLIEVEAAGAMLPVGLHQRQTKGEHMLNTSNGRSNAEMAEPAGVEASNITELKDISEGVSGGVAPSDCGCGGGGSAAPDLVFAIGELGYDLITEARKDSLWQAMHDDPYDWKNLAKHLEANPWDAEAVTWTLRIDATPIYAIRPTGPFAAEGYKRLADYLVGQLGDPTAKASKDRRRFDRISIPGKITGSAMLMNGITVPVVAPALRGMFAWDTQSLVDAVLKDVTNAKERTELASALTNFLERVYYDLRNMGRSPDERAKNFAATNAYQASTVFRSAQAKGFALDAIEVEKSPICRQDSDCWDVTLTFFDPKNDRAARDVNRFTIDVSDVVPCTVGPVRNWFVR